MKKKPQKVSISCRAANTWRKPWLQISDQELDVDHVASSGVRESYGRVKFFPEDVLHLSAPHTSPSVQCKGSEFQ